MGDGNEEKEYEERMTFIMITVKVYSFKLQQLLELTALCHDMQSSSSDNISQEPLTLNTSEFC